MAVANDEDAYLSLDPISDTARSFSYDDPGRLGFSIPGPMEDTPAEGVGQNSTYEFDELVTVENRGDDTVVVWSESSPTGPVESVYLTTPSRVLDSKRDGVELGPGEGFSAGLLIETTAGTGDFETSVTIRAEQRGVSGFPGSDI